MIFRSGSRLAVVLDRFRSRATEAAMGIYKRSSTAPAGDAATHNRGEVKSEQAEQLDTWEDEGGTPFGQPPASSEAAAGAALRR